MFWKAIAVLGLFALMMSSVSLSAYAKSGSTLPIYDQKGETTGPIVPAAGTGSQVSTGSSVSAGGIQPLTNYAEVIMGINANYTVLSSSSTTPPTGSCTNTMETPCFSIQLTVENTAGSDYQWVFFIQHGMDIIGCVTSTALGLGCSSNNNNVYTFTSFPSDGFVNDEFEIIFSSSSSYSMELVDGSTHQSTSVGSGNLNNLEGWEVGSGVGISNSACAVWQSGASWSVSGYAPSGSSLGTLNTSPSNCTTAGNVNFSGGNALWSTTGVSVGTTTEFSDLTTFSFTYNSATNFVYTNS